MITSPRPRHDLDSILTASKWPHPQAVYLLSFISLVTVIFSRCLVLSTGSASLSRIIQSYSYDWLFCHETEISDPCWIAWVSGVSEGEGGRRAKEKQKGRQWGERKLFTLFPLLLSLAPKEGHILKLDSRFTVAALELFYCSRNLCVYNPCK